MVTGNISLLGLLTAKELATNLRHKVITKVEARRGKRNSDPFPVGSVVTLHTSLMTQCC